MKEFHITYSRDGGSESSQFSSTGLQHMGTVLSMENSGTQLPVPPPLCHPSSDRLNKTTPYTFEDFKRDVELRATFFKPEKAVITPTLPPPDSSKLAALLLKAEADASEGRRDEQAKVHVDSRKKLEKNEKEGCDGFCVTSPSKSVGGSPSLLSCSSSTAAAINAQIQKTDDDLIDVKEDSSAMQSERSSRKSPSLCRSDVSLDGSSLHDSSLTSYQVPSSCHGHSTPVGRGGASSEEGEESIKEGVEPARDREGTPLSLSPVKGKKEATPKPRPLLVSGVYNFFKPDNFSFIMLMVLSAAAIHANLSPAVEEA